MEWLHLLAATAGFGVGLFGVAEAFSGRFQGQYARAHGKFKVSVARLEGAVDAWRGTDSDAWRFYWTRPTGIVGHSDFFTDSGLGLEPPGPDHQVGANQAAVSIEISGFTIPHPRRGHYQSGRAFRTNDPDRFDELSFEWPSHVDDLQLRIGTPLAKVARIVRRESELVNRRLIERWTSAPHTVLPWTVFQHLLWVLVPAAGMFGAIHRFRWSRRAATVGSVLGLTAGLAAMVGWILAIKP